MYTHELGPLSGRTVVLLRGCPLPPDHFDSLAQELSKTSRVIVPDLPGHGRSPPVAKTVDAGNHRIVDLLASRGIAEVSLVGVSLGGYRALSLAMDGRIRVDSVVAISAFAGLSDEERSLFRTAAQAVRNGDDLTDLFIGRAITAEARSRLPWLVTRVREWIAALAVNAWPTELEAIAASPDLRARLPDSHGACWRSRGPTTRRCPRSTAKKWPASRMDDWSKSRAVGTSCSKSAPSSSFLWLLTLLAARVPPSDSHSRVAGGSP